MMDITDFFLSNIDFSCRNTDVDTRTPIQYLKFLNIEVISKC